MAKIELGAIVTDVRGKVSGVVFSKNKGGAYVKAKVSSVQPRTPEQIFTRSVFARLSKAYSNTLDNAQRDAWQRLAGNFPSRDIFGNTHVLSALAMFQSVNAVIRHAGLDLLTDPPVNQDVMQMLSITVTATASGPSLDVSFLPSPLNGNHVIYIYATPPLPPAVKYIERRFRFLGVGPLGDISPSSFLAKYTDRFGTLIAGQRIGFQVCVANLSNGAVNVGARSIISVGV